MKKLIWLLVVTSLSLSLSNSKTSKTPLPYHALYDTCIVHIKQNEGFRSNIYRDSQGYKYVGYGHLILKKESITSLTKQEADLLLRKDFNKIMAKVKLFTPGLNENQILAMTLFSYNFGVYFYTGSKMYKMIKSRQTIDDIILNYCHLYNGKGKLVKSPKLYKRRQFELWLYNYDTGIKR